MDLDSLAIDIRPRTPWEAIDLGFAMARHWFLPLWLIWLALALPLLLLVQWLFPDRPGLCAIALWWMKPLYEPPLLFWLSRALFGESLSPLQALRRWPGYGHRQLLANLSWRRLSPNRSFYMPVAVLEGLKRSERKERISVLGRAQHVPAWLTLGGWLFELLLQLSLLLLIWVMLPGELRPFDLQQLLVSPGQGVDWLRRVADLAVMSLFAPFYVAAGFALYLNRRTELEAWDLEIGFHRLLARLRPAAGGRAVGLLLACLLLLQPAFDPVQAAGFERAQVRREIDTVLAEETFGERRLEGYWHYRLQTAEGDGTGRWQRLLTLLQEYAALAAKVAEGMLWVGAGLLLGWLLYRYFSARRGAPGNRVATKGAPPPEERVLSGPAPGKASPGLGRRVRERLEAGDLRGGLGLLYRGALSRVALRHRLEIMDSTTEQECLALVAGVCPREEELFLQRLTGTWMQLAYDHVPPSAQRIEALCRDWERLFEGDST
ncbi:MAG TPA: hypothetical protein ENK50_09250 [Sedimenticola sp.]|nr:hypothetical protein [Sedimenticola sp.]